MFVWPVHVDATPARPGGKFSEKADGELRLEIATVNPPGTDGWRKEFEADACGEREGSGRPEEHGCGAQAWSLGTRRMRPIANASRLAGHPDPELERRDHRGEREEGVSGAWADRAQGALEPRGER